MPAATTAEQEAIDRILRWRREPVDFTEEFLGVELWSKQREVLNLLRDHNRVAVRACHGPGKTYAAAAAVLWFLTLPGARVVTTAPTWTQVEALLWHEINQLYSGARLRYGGECLQTKLKLPDGRYAIGLSTKPEQRESFQGHHAENILLIYDEASGVPQPIYEAGEGYLTTAGAKQLLIGNPTRAQGDFYDAFHKNRASYARLHISAFDLPWATGEEVSDRVLAHLTTEEWVENAGRKWGTDSIAYQVKVLGEFAESADDTVMGLAEVEEAQEREVLVAPDDLRVIACDVARFGSDECVISLREGLRVRIKETYTGHAITETSGAIIRLAKEVKRDAPHADLRIVVDDAGVGGGVTDMVREAGFSVTAFNGGNTAVEEDEYPNARSELWFVLQSYLSRIDLDPDEQLAADLVAPIYKLDRKGRREVEPKDKTKKRLSRSPDRGDSVQLCFAPDRTSSVAEVWR